MKHKYKVGDVVIWHRPWFTPDMELKVTITSINENSKDYPYKGIWTDARKKNLYQGFNIFAESELKAIGSREQLTLF